MSGPSIYGGGYDNILRRGLGLGQWTDTKDGSTRHTLLLDFAKNKNKKCIIWSCKSNLCLRVIVLITLRL